MWSSFAVVYDSAKLSMILLKMNRIGQIAGIYYLSGALCILLLLSAQGHLIMQLMSNVLV